MQNIDNYLRENKLDFTISDRGMRAERYCFEYEGFRVSYKLEGSILSEDNSQVNGVSNLYYNTLLELRDKMEEYGINCDVDYDVEVIDYTLPEPKYQVDQRLYKMINNRVEEFKVQAISVGVSKKYGKDLTYKGLGENSDTREELLFETKEDLLKSL